MDPAPVIIHQPTTTHALTYPPMYALRTNSYQPQEVEVETPLKPFIPDYLPAVGEMDAFLKVAFFGGVGGNV